MSANFHFMALGEFDGLTDDRGVTAMITAGHVCAVDEGHNFLIAAHFIGAKTFA